MSETDSLRSDLLEAMNFLGAMAAGLEEALGDPSKSISYLAGEKLGLQFSSGANRVDDLQDALQEVSSILYKNHCLWAFEPFKKKSEKEMVHLSQEGEEIMLVFRDCMIRQSLFCYGHPQKGSLCNMMFGFFSGALKNITGYSSRLEIVHAGENACYKRLTLFRKQNPLPA